MKLGSIRHRGDLHRALDTAVEFGVDRVREQLLAAGFEGLDLCECLVAERRRLTEWRDQIEAEMAKDLPDAPTPQPTAA
jgi:hypothetical protein